MKKVLDEALTKLDGYLISITRNTETSQYEIQVGIPKDWIYEENDMIGFDVDLENELGSVIKVYGKTTDIVIDDLIHYVNVIIDTNKRIAEMQEEFERKLEEEKEAIVKKVSDFQNQINQMKQQSFSAEKEEKEEKKKITRNKKTTTKKKEDVVDDNDTSDEDKLIEKLS